LNLGRPDDSNMVYLGVMNNGFPKQDFTPGIIALADSGLRGAAR